MKLNLRAKHLATVLYENAGDDVENINDSLQQIEELLVQNAQFRSLIQSKRLSDEQKSKVMRHSFDQVVEQLVIEFLCIICKERNIDLIRQVAKVFAELYREKAGIVEIQALVSENLDDSSAESLRLGLEQALNKKTDMKIEVDDQLLGGIKLRIENTFLDASLKSQLERLQGTLLQS